MAGTLKFSFQYELPDSQQAQIVAFHDSLDEAAIEQYPGWHDVVGTPGRICHCSALSKGNVVCYAQIVEQGRKHFETARVQFGPVFADPDVLIESVKEIHRHYTDAGFMYLAIQLGIPTSSTADYIEYKLNRDLKISYRFDRHNWSSLIADLSAEPEDILRKFSKGHKSTIKKSWRQGLTVESAEQLTDVRELCDIYVKMYEARNNPVDPEATRLLFANAFQFLRDTNKGFMLITRDGDGAILGGVIVVLQGNSARYYKGAADPDRRDVSVLHPAVFEAMKVSKQRGARYFDLWGYNHFVDQTDPIYHINKFKKGFSKTYIFYPKIMHCELKPIRHRSYDIMRRLARR